MIEEPDFEIFEADEFYDELLIEIIFIIVEVEIENQIGCDHEQLILKGDVIVML